MRAELRLWGAGLAMGVALQISGCQNGPSAGGEQKSANADVASGTQFTAPGPTQANATLTLESLNLAIKDRAIRVREQSAGRAVWQPNVSNPLSSFAPSNEGYVDISLAAELRWLTEERIRLQRVHGRVDDRMSIWQLELQANLNPEWRTKMRQANAVLGLFTPASILRQGATWEISGLTLKERFQLCDGEKFETELTVVYCTAFLVGPTTAVTARHCVKPDGTDEQQHASSLLAVAKYWSHGDGDSPRTMPVGNVSKVLRVSSMGETKLDDWAVIELARHIPGTETLQISSDPHVAIDSAIYTFGFPHGISMKYVDGAKVTTSTEGKRTFIVSLDVFRGNSGSPVIDAATNEVKGIVSTVFAGDWATVKKSKMVNGVAREVSCNVPFVCVNEPGFSSCNYNGEEIVRASLIRWEGRPVAQLIPFSKGSMPSE